MRINREQKHVIFYGEDRATSDMAQGFVEARNVNDLRCEVFHEYGHGWQSTTEAIEKVKLARYPLTHLVLVIDFDQKGRDNLSHLKVIQREIAGSPHKDRVYVIGASKDVQQLQQKFTAGNHIGKTSPHDVGVTVGEASFKDDSCIEGIWGEPELAHNANELVRLCRDAKDVLFL